VVGNETTQEPIVGRVDDRIHGQGGDIASPKDKVLSKRQPRAREFREDGWQGFESGYTFCLTMGRKEVVLQCKQFWANGDGRAEIHQCPQ
jgi:hypothetical protein